MPSFNMSKVATPVPVAPPKLPTMSLAEVVEVDPAPINGMNVVGRVVMLFGSQAR